MAGLQKERKNIIKTVHDLLFVQKEPVLAEYLLLFLVFLVPFVTMMYGDTKAFVHYGVNFWKSITEGGGLHNFMTIQTECLHITGRMVLEGHMK